MTNPLHNQLIQHGIIFSLIPIISTYLLGHAFKFAFSDTIESAGGLPPGDPDAMLLPQVEFILPFALLSGIIAFTVWYFFLSKRRTKWNGLWAGITTVFVSYPILGFAIGFIYPHFPPRLNAGIGAAVDLTIIGQMLTFWITYPIGAVCGFIIAERMLKKMGLDISTQSIFD